MAITDISVSEELMTNAPSIKYRGDEGPKSPQEMEKIMMMSSVDDPFYRSGDEDEHSFRMFGKPYKELNADELEEFREEMMRLMNKFSKGPILPSPEDPVNPFGPKPQGPVLPDRQMAAYGGIMGMDGRKKYGIGSFFQKYIKDPIEVAITGKTFEDLEEESQRRVDAEPEGYEGVFDRLFKGEKKVKDGKEYREGGLDKYIIPAIGGITAGLFTKKNQDGSVGGQPTADETALMLADLKKSANVLDQQQGLAAGLNFLPAVSARKFTPEQMIETYKASAANGGRIGFSEGLLAGPTAQQRQAEQSISTIDLDNFIDAGQGIKLYGGQPIIKNYYSKEDSGRRNEAFFEVIDPITGSMSTISEVDFYKKYGKPNAYGGRIGFDNGGGFSQNDLLLLKKFKMNPKEVATYKDGGKELLESLRTTYIPKAEGGIMDLGGMEKDYRAEGGFVPIGREEKADDVPARLSVNEFVFTADAVRNAGGGDIDQGARVMENMMKHLEAGGQVSEESQGMQGARDMFEVSERLSEVV